MKLLKLIAIFLPTLTVGILIAGQFGAFSGKTPANLGVTNGRLSPPSPTPNSVSSQATLYPTHPQKDDAYIEPLAYIGNHEVAMKKLVEVLKNSDRMQIMAQQPDYLYVQCRTALLKFTDDLEFWQDKENKVIHVRSASRLGRNDFGVNRARIEKIRARFVP